MRDATYAVISNPGQRVAAVTQAFGRVFGCLGGGFGRPSVLDATHSTANTRLRCFAAAIRTATGIDCAWWGRGPVQGKVMPRSTQARFALTVAFAVIAVSLAAASARAFSQESGGSGGSENSAFSDPDEQVNIFGQGGEPQSFGSSGSAQYDTRQQGRLNAFKHPQINSLTSPPDLLSRPGN
jgi:hypothetical protein